MEVAVIIEKKGVKQGFEFCLAFSPLCWNLASQQQQAAAAAAGSSSKTTDKWWPATQGSH